MKKKYNITAFLYDKKGNILSVGKNSYVKSHPVQARLAKQMGMEHRHFLHAEISALIRCKRLDKAHSMFVCRFDREGNPANAKPCPICQEAIRMAGIKEVRWT
jgi:deoxycytidylate deaminase